MRWFKPNLRSSIYGIFSPGPPQGESATLDEVIDIEVVRKEMLALLVGSHGEGVAIVSRRISYAGEIQGLWFLRGELMAVLAKTHGESEGHARITQVSKLFDGLVPDGLRSRGSPLRS